MVKYLPDILSEINADPEMIHKYMKDSAFSIIMHYAFDPEKKMILPEGEPAYKKDSAPIGCSPTNLRYESKRLYVFCRGDVTQLKREILFVQLLESLHPSEAVILLAIKDQNLESLYPNINKVLISQFGFCPLPTKEEKKPEQALSKSEDVLPEVAEKVVEQETEESVERKSTKSGKGRKKAE